MENEKCVIQNRKIICNSCITKNKLNREYCFMCGKKLIVDSKELEEAKKLEPKRTWKTVTTITVCIIVIISLAILNVVSENKYNILEENFKNLTKKVSTLEEKIKTKDAEIKELKQEENKKKIQNEIDDLSSTKNILENENNSLEETKKSLENDINSLKADIIKEKGKAKKFSAGNYIAGEDFKEGRYKIYGGNSNFFVHSSSGKLKVNTILGNKDDDFSVKEYIYNFDYGDVIEAHSAFKLKSVE